MNKKIILITSLLFSFIALYATNNPVAKPAAIVTTKNARFTILTSGVIRMEWSGRNSFNDQATFVVVNRNLPVPEFAKKEENGWLIITTSEMELWYKKNSGKFTKENLNIKYKKGTQFQTWKPGDQQLGNLKGTYRTVDRYLGDTFIEVNGKSGEKMPIDNGIIATDGWTLLDDSHSFLFDNSDWPWVQKRKKNDTQDLYFMAYGNNYKKALKDFSLIAGKVPLPPKYAFGYWWSRYWNYSDNELRDLVANFEKLNLPLDVLVIDMDWHKTDSIHSPQKDEFGQMKHWTGWDWDTNLFTNPKQFLDWTAQKNLQVTLNLHPASGIAPYESSYQKFAKAVNFNTSTGKNVPWRGSDKKTVTTLFDLILHPMEKDGVDFWWLDWQQWLNDKEVENLNNTWWLNYLFFTDMERNRDTRPMLYHRWGGLGNHRYQVGFSGDAFIGWESLAFQPYFTSTASNVLYTYWSHDLGGHMFLKPNDTLDPELYVRWMQYGVFSPIFRTHSSKDARLNKEIWKFNGDYFDALRNSILLRYQLVPYIYTMARKTYDEGLGLCRPMYYDYPENDQSYNYPQQFMFGDDILISPVISPCENGASKIKVWLPEGSDWYEWQTGTMLKGGQELVREFGLSEYPIYIKAGSIIPMYKNNVKNLQQNINEITIAVFPGNNGEFILYDDNGDDQTYPNNYTTTKINHQLKNRTQKITIEPTTGKYDGMKLLKNYRIKVYGAEVPQKVIVNDSILNYNSIEDNKSWTYKGDELAIIIPISNISCLNKQNITIEYSKTEFADINQGLVKQMREFEKKYITYKFANSAFPGWVVPRIVGQCEELNRKLEYQPQNFYKEIDYFMKNYNEANELIKSKK